MPHFLALLVLCLLAAPARAQFQVTTFDSGSEVEINSTTRVAVATLPVEGSGVRDVALTAHVYLEGAGFDGSQYAVGICRGSATGTLVGFGFWSPGEKTPTSGVFEADTVTVTAFDSSVTLPATYVVCVSKQAASSPAVTAWVRGFNAQTAPPGTRLAGVTPSGLVPIQTISSTTPVAVGGVPVDAGAGSDVVLVAHVALRGAELGEGRAYEVSLCRGGPAGTVVGRAWWRPPLSSGLSGDVVSVTGFDAGRSGMQSYGLCVRKAHGDAPDVDATFWGIHASVAPAGTTHFGVQSTDFSFKTLDSTSFVPLSEVVIADPRSRPVRLAAHAYLEPVAPTQARYEIDICRGSTVGVAVGRAFWRPLRVQTDTHFAGDTVALTGYDAEPGAGPAKYVLCGRKFDVVGSDVRVYMRGLVATVPEPDAGAGAALAALALVALRRRRARCG